MLVSNIPTVLPVSCQINVTHVGVATTEEKMVLKGKADPLAFL